MGSTKENQQAREDERPQHQVRLEAFRIGRHPVTSGQYKVFVKAAGYEKRDYWTEAGWKWREGENVTKPLYSEDPKWNQADHPVVGVSWHEALAYCRWLSEASGHDFRLPTEAEWEKAARGEHAREWPWGNEFDPKRANTSESGPGRTTPVGSYAREGDSPYGAEDMAGNVWEWCSTLFRDYPYRADDGRENLEAEGSRVLRGGSWGSLGSYLRCAARNYHYPSYTSLSHGFRVASSPSSP